jgi:hypothetical protein
MTNQLTRPTRNNHLKSHKKEATQPHQPPPTRTPNLTGAVLLDGASIDEVRPASKF